MRKEVKKDIRNYKYKAELTKLTEQKRTKKPKFYLVYSLIILCLAYMVDEIASNIHGVVQTDAVGEFFANNPNTWTIIITIASGVSILSFIFRSLADKYGRKPFLYINLFGMAIGMFFCFIAPNIYLYVIGLIICFFFTPCDIQVLYIIETSSDRRRALNLSFAKAIGIIGISLISVFRKYFDIRGWHGVFLFPAIIGLVVGLLALFFMKESDVFIDNKIKIIKEKIKSNNKKNEKEVQTNKQEKEENGLIAAVKYMFNKKVLLWLFVVLFTFSIASAAQANYATVLQPLNNDIYQAMSDADYNAVILVYPFSCALIIILNGVISDLFGRKKAGIFDTIVALVGIIYFLFGTRISWNPYLLGVLLGIFIGGYFAGLDTINVICTEVSPTSIRSSVMSILSIASSGGTSIATLILILLREFISPFDMSVFLAILVPPVLAFSLFVLLKKIPETQGINFQSIEMERVEKKTKRTSSPKIQ